MPSIDALLITLIAYKLALLAIGVWAQRSNRDEADFLLGGRRLGPLVAAISASASSSSVWTLLGVSGFAYETGLQALWLLPACIGGFALNWLVVAPRLRQLASAPPGPLTVTEVLAGPHRGPGFGAVRWAASLILIFCLTAYVASQFQGAGLSFEKSFGMSAEQAVLVGAAIVVIYTVLGGFWAVSLTDTLQGLMMAASAVALPAAAIWATGGFFGLAEGVRDVDAAGYASLSGPEADTTAAILAIVALLGIGLGYPGQPHVVNRFMALRDGAALRRARSYAMAWAVLVYSGMVLLGLCGRVLHEASGSVLTGGDNEAIFFQLSGELFPAALAGVLLAVVLSAIMSTADSQLLVISSAISHDLGWRSATPSGDLARSRLVVVLVSAAAVALALQVDESIFSSVLFAWSALGAAFGPLLLVTLWRGPVGSTRSLLAMVLGFATSVAAYSSSDYSGTAAERVLPFVLAGAVCLIGTPRTAP